MKNEEIYHTVALFNIRNEYICDLTGNQEHIETQMLNIAKLISSNLEPYFKVTKEGFEVRRKGMKAVSLTAVIQ